MGLFSVRMEDEMLTAVTQKAQVATVAPLPSISNRLSVADFQKISGESADGGKSPGEGPPLPQVAVTVARAPPDCPASPGTNLAFEADFNNISAQLRGRKLGVTTATTLEFDQTIGKWCLKNLTGSKSFDHQLESSVIEVGNNNLGCLRHVIKCEYSVKHGIFSSLILFFIPANISNILDGAV